MQVLYTQSRDTTIQKKELKNIYFEKIEESFELLLFALYTIINVTKVSTDDQDKRKKKHLQNEFDEIFTAKLWDNYIIQTLVNNPYLRGRFEKSKFAQRVDKDLFSKIYYEFAKEQAYIDYVQGESTDELHLEILLELFRHCRKNEIYLELIEDNYAHWEDDKSIIIGTIKKVFKSLPSSNDKFILEQYPDELTVNEYGDYLLEKVAENDDALLKLIVPVLENWDAERVAILDMIMLKMAISEFMYCPTIPTKVTLNEYVELAKTYSTSKSKDFINGILDKLMKTLTDQNLIHKEGRGLLET